MTEQERYEKLNKILEDGYPLKNDIFMIFAKNKDFCQEFLRVILQDDELEVIENDIQKVIPSAFNKNVVLDMICRLKDKRIANVEIQLNNEKHHAKRLMTYASKIRVYDLKKGDDYENTNDIIIIYLTLDDILKKGSTVYEVKMDIVSDQGERIDKWDAGLKIIYVNTKGLTNKTINEYLTLLTDRTTINSRYKMTSKIKEDLFKRGGVIMSKEMMEVLDDVREEGMQQGIQQGMQQGIQQGIINILIRQFNEKKISAKEGAEYLGVSIDDFLKLV